MPLLNYTTSVSADKSIAAIQKALAKAGASAILHEFDDNGNIMALSFRIKMPSPDAGGAVHDISFRLPTDWRAVQRRLQTQRVEPRYRTQEHALRVAWRITKDWVEAQLAIIESQMVTTAQVFLPYAVTSNGQTLYEYIGQNTQLLLGEGKLLPFPSSGIVRDSRVNFSKSSRLPKHGYRRWLHNELRRYR